MKNVLTLLIFCCITSGVAYSQQKSIPVTNDKNKLPAQTSASQQTNVSPNAPQNLPVTYTFTGDGNWNVPGNWTNNVVPPQPTNLGSEIIINNIAGGECILNIPYTVTPGTSLTILAGKTLIAPSLVVN